MSFTIRPYTSSDLETLHQINVASQPGVGAVSVEALSKIIAEGTCHVAANDAGAPLGFLLTLGPGAGYASKNYQWFDERYEDYIYVDRIALAPDTRGQGIGTALYEHAFKAFTGEALLIGCEVNTAPPNPASLRFHKRLGFEEVGAQSYAADYAVAYLAKRLTS